MQKSDLSDMFEPFSKLILVKICGKKRELPENNSILRGLQFNDMDGISGGEFCWNGDCLNCQVWIRHDEREKAVMACRTEVREGMEIVRVSDEIAAEFEPGD